MTILYLITLDSNLPLFSLERTAEILERQFHWKYVGVRIAESQTVIAQNGKEKKEEYNAIDLVDSLIPRGFGREILAITDHKLIKPNGSWVGGICNPLARKALVSRYNFCEKSFSEYALISASLHEVGHFFGLEHHVTINPSRKYCPLVTPYALAKRDNLSESIPEHFLEFDHSFCSDCTTLLRK